MPRPFSSPTAEFNKNKNTFCDGMRYRLIAAQCASLTPRLLTALVSWHMDAYYAEKVVQYAQNTYKACIIISKLNMYSRIFQLSTFRKDGKGRIKSLLKKII